MFNLEEETKKADEKMNNFVDSLKVKDLKDILKKNEIRFSSNMLKPALQDKLLVCLSNKLTNLVTSEDGIEKLLPVWTLSLCRERAQWFLYHCDRQVTFSSISEALQFQNNCHNVFPDDGSIASDSYSSSDEDNSSEDNSNNESLASSNSISSSVEKITKKGSAIDTKAHIAKSTFDFSMDTNMKERSKHSRFGFRERIVMAQKKLINERNSKKLNEDEVRVETLKCHNLFCCNAVDPDTKSQCIAGPFVTEYHLKRHKELCEKGNSKHTFPSINSLTSVLIDIQQGKTSPLCLACGALPNRDAAAAGLYQVKPPHPIPECIDPMCVGPGCYRRDNKSWKQKQFRASPELLIDLETLFQDGEDRSKGGMKRNAGKYSATEAIAVLKNMMDSNGRRKYRIDGPFGRLPTAKYVKAWFSRRKNKGAKIFLSSGGSNENDTRKDDRFSCMSLEELKDEFENIFDCPPTKKFLCIKLLEIDDELKYEGHDNVYTGLKLNELEEECKSRNLPFVVGSNGLQVALRSHNMKINCQKHRSTMEYRNAVNITDAAEEILSHRNRTRGDEN